MRGYDRTLLLKLILAVVFCLLAYSGVAEEEKSRTGDARTMIARVYHDELGREPDAEGMAVHLDCVIGQGKDEAWLRQSLRNSEEGRRVKSERRKTLFRGVVYTAVALMLLGCTSVVVTRRGLWKKVLLLGISCLLVLIVLELALRILHYKPTFNALEHSDRSPIYYRIDPERLHPFAGREDVLRIAVVGDSFAHGVGVQEDDRFASKLERMLNANAKTRPAVVEVFAECGTSTFQQMPLVEQALAVGPELVILSVCLNDAENWRRPHEILAWRNEMQPVPPPVCIAPAIRASRLLGMIYLKIQHSRARKGYYRYYERLYDPAYSGWQMFTNAVAAMQQACAEKGVGLVVVLHPLLTESFELGIYPFEYAHEAIRNSLETQRVPLVNVLDRLRNVVPVRMTVIPSIDPHPSEIAHRIISEALFDYMLAEGYIGADYKLRWRQSELKLEAQWRESAERMNVLSNADGL